MLKGADVLLNTDFLLHRNEYETLCKRIVYTGPIDAYYKYCYGYLQYRSLRFEDTLYYKENYQGCAAINETDATVPYTRSIEHKHFEFGTQPVTIVTREFSEEWKEGAEPFYPINNKRNTEVFNRYNILAQEEKHIIFGGRLADYKYYDMDVVIQKALERDLNKIALP